MYLLTPAREDILRLSRLVRHALVQITRQRSSFLLVGVTMYHTSILFGFFLLNDFRHMLRETLPLYVLWEYKRRVKPIQIC